MISAAFRLHLKKTMDSDDSEKENLDDSGTYTMDFKEIWEKFAEMAKYPDFLIRSLKLMPLNSHLPDYENITLDNISVKIDEEANKLLGHYNEKNFVAYHSTPDGNCLFNAVSICLFGSEMYRNLLRLKTLKYIGNNFEILKESGRLPTSDCLKETMLDCAKDYAWSNILTVFCLAQALQIKINAVYPPVNGICDMNYLTLPKVLEPMNGLPLKEIYLMWSSAEKYEISGNFQPNHFVPLLEKTSQGGQTNLLANNMDEYLKKTLVNMPSQLGNQKEYTQNMKLFKDVRTMVTYMRLAECIKQVPKCKIYNAMFVVEGHDIHNLKNFKDSCGEWKRFKTAIYRNIVGCNLLVSFYFHHREFPNYKRTIHVLDEEKKALFQYSEPGKDYAGITEYTPNEAEIADIILNTKFPSTPKTTDCNTPNRLYVYGTIPKVVELSPCISIPCTPKTKTVHLRIPEDKSSKSTSEIIELNPANYKDLTAMHCKFYYSGCTQEYKAFQFVLKDRCAVIYQNSPPNKCICNILIDYTTAPQFDLPKNFRII